MNAIDELLAREEARAIADLERSLVGLGETLITATNARGKVRARPLLAVASAALAGFVTAPMIIRTLRRAGASKTTSRLLSALPPSLRKQLVSVSLRSALGKP